MRPEVVDAGQTELVLYDILQLLMERHQLLLIPELMREMEPESGLQLILVTFIHRNRYAFIAHLLGLGVHPQVEEAARQIDVRVLEESH